MPESRDERIKKLTELFRIAGAPSPEARARSEILENIPQLARFMFLREAWSNVVADGDTSWIDHAVEHGKSRAGQPGTGLGLALQRLLATGCTREDLTEVARTMQWQLLFGLCYQIDDERNWAWPEELQHIGWVLKEANQDGTLGRNISGLHESVLETDPTGREMRPRNAESTDER
jgi:hypothetical protein